MRPVVKLLPLFLVAVESALAGESWPQFRGPNGDGTAPAKNVPITWSETNHLAWKTETPGRGRSSPVIAKDRIWITTALETGTQRTQIGPDDMQVADRVILEAVSVDFKSGKILWRTKLFEVEKPEPVHWYNSWATPSPVLENGRLYCDFGTYGTAALDAKSGKIVWSTRLPLDHQVGPGSSPILWKDLLILARDGRDAQFICALNKQTGKQEWRTERPPIDGSNGNLKKSFVTPLVVKSGGRTQIVAPAAHWIMGYEPATGAELWRIRHGNGFSIGSCPVFDQGLAIFSTGCMKAQMLAVRVDGAGDVTEHNISWRSPKQVPVMSSPVLAGSEIYWVSDEGMVTCADTHTGEVHWQERLGGLHLASLLVAEGRIYVFAQDGRTTVIKAAKQFEKLAENKIEGPLVATPAIVDGAILLRTDSHLYRVKGS